MSEDQQIGLVLGSVGIEANVMILPNPWPANAEAPSLDELPEILAPHKMADIEPTRCRQPRGAAYAVVGDWVRLQREMTRPIIDEILPRRNMLQRAQAREIQILASNVDRLYLVLALEPISPPRFVDRWLATAASQDVPATLLVNKVDLAESDEELEEELEWLDVYRDAGYPIQYLSADRGDGIEALAATLQQGLSMLAGHSGVGKSSLLNKLLPRETIAVGEISWATGKGKHTTTTAVAYRMERSLVVDMPGVREFGIAGLEPGQLRDCFVEFLPFADGCKFGDCRHMSEPGCAVKKAVKAGKLPASRYESYTALVSEAQVWMDTIRPHDRRADVSHKWMKRRLRGDKADDDQ